jgi:radical SAM protein with 4Fe4S-binding SPASM domain
MEDVETFLRRWGDIRMDGYGLCVVEGNWTSDTRTVREIRPSEACPRALSQIYVTYDGKATTCCFDPTGKQTFGNLNEQTIREVYNGVDYVTFREDHANNRADKYDICKGCTRI